MLRSINGIFPKSKNMRLDLLIEIFFTKREAIKNLVNNESTDNTYN